MAEIQPFRGVRYNQLVVKELSEVICPPYDVISPELQRELYRRSEYNFVRLENGLELPQDTATDNRFTRSAAMLSQWLEQGVLKVDQVPAIYLHHQHFSSQGKSYRRRGLITLVRLEEWDKRVVRPHEGTLTGPTSQRLNLLWAIQANTSPILTLYEDEGQQISSLLAIQEQREPVITVSGANGEEHRVWAITDSWVIGEIGRRLAGQPLYIADGHHRYESALTYRQERQACASSKSADEAFNLVMMTLVDFADPGLIILPPHRLVRGISKSALSELLAKLRLFFEIEELPLSAPDVFGQVDNILAGGEVAAGDEVRLVLFGLPSAGSAGRAEHLLVLRLHDFTQVAQMMPYFHAELYMKLDVSIADHVILDKLLGLEGGGEATITYSYDKQEAVKQVLDQEYQLALLLSPIKPKVIKVVADVGDRMPKKSTYFYPKLPAGLVFYRWG